MARLKPKRPFTKKHVFDAIISEWIRAARYNQDPDPTNIKLVLDHVLDFNDPQGTRRIAIIVDINSGGNRTHYLSIPLPENGASTVADWINGKYGTTTAQDGFADAVLYGCGR